MFGKIRREFLAAFVAVILLALPAIPALAQEQPVAPPAAEQQSVFQPSDFNDLLGKLSQIIERFYAGKTPGAKKLLYGAAKGLVRSLDDPHSAFFTPEETELFEADTQGSFGGIGATLRMERDGVVSIVGVTPGSPAERAGIRKDDLVFKIGGQMFEGLSFPEVIMRIRGPIGTDVVLEIARKGEIKPLVFTLQREKISLNTDVKLAFDGDIAVITIPTFGKDTFMQLVRAALGAKAKQDLRGVVVDLRGNGGGLLNVCGHMLMFWIDFDSPYVRLRTKGVEENLAPRQAPPPGPLNEEEERNALNTLLAFDGVPTVVLMNGASASASEIFAGALQDYGLATVIGEKSYGKGSVQTAQSFPDGSSLHLTTMLWLTPKGRVVEKKGIAPDIPVEFTREDIEQKRDPQLKRALEFLRTGK